MNYKQTIKALESRIHDQYGDVKTFCRTIGKSESWFSNIRNGRRTLTFENLSEFTEALGVEISITVNGSVEYEIHNLMTDRDRLTSLWGTRTVNPGNYAGLWQEFVELNMNTCTDHRDDAWDDECRIDDVDTDALRDFILIAKEDGIKFPKFRTPGEMLQVVFYRCIREFDGEPIVGISRPTSFPLENYNWGLTGEYCQTKKRKNGDQADEVPF